MSEDSSEESCGNTVENEWDDEPEISRTSRRLIEGINIKDLCDGKEVLFEINKEETETKDSEEDNFEEVVHYDSQALREKRKAPILIASFETLTSQMFNITEDGFVKKQVITNGTGQIVPKHAYVTVHYNLYKRNCELPFDSTYLRNRPEKFRLDQGETILGLECAIKSMKKGENSRFFIKWEVAFGALGCPDRIEEKCDIIADVTLMNFVELDQEQDLNALTTSELNRIDFRKSLAEVKKLICIGGDEFKKGECRGAIYNYKKGLRILNSLRLADEKEESLMLEQKLRCLINLAVCYNKVGRSEQACVMCQEALSIDPNNAKAYFHYGRANLVLSNFDAAQKLLTRAAKLNPNDKDINKEFKKLNDKKALYQAKDKIFWKKVFDKNETEGKQDSCLENFQQA